MYYTVTTVRDSEFTPNAGSSRWVSGFREAAPQAAYTLVYLSERSKNYPSSSIAGARQPRRRGRSLCRLIVAQRCVDILTSVASSQRRASLPHPSSRFNHLCTCTFFMCAHDTEKTTIIPHKPDYDTLTVNTLTHFYCNPPTLSTLQQPLRHRYSHCCWISSVVSVNVPNDTYESRFASLVFLTRSTDLVAKADVYCRVCYSYELIPIFDVFCSFCIPHINLCHELRRWYSTVADFVEYSWNPANAQLLYNTCLKRISQLIWPSAWSEVY